MIYRSDLIKKLSKQIQNASADSIDVSNQMLRDGLAMWFIDNLDGMGLLKTESKEDGLCYIKVKDDSEDLLKHFSPTELDPT